MCPDFSTRSIDQYQDCNFGTVANDIVMTSGMKTDDVITLYKNFVLQLDAWFNTNGAYKNEFELFSSMDYEYMGRNNLMFNDATKSLVDVGDRDRYYLWVGEYHWFFANNKFLVQGCGNLFFFFYSSTGN